MICDDEMRRVEEEKSAFQEEEEERGWRVSLRSPVQVWDTKLAKKKIFHGEESKFL
jgi:hypothetical protein